MAKNYSSNLIVLLIIILIGFVLFINFQYDFLLLIFTLFLTLIIVMFVLFSDFIMNSLYTSISVISSGIYLINRFLFYNSLKNKKTKKILKSKGIELEKIIESIYRFKFGGWNYNKLNSKNIRILNNYFNLYSDLEINRFIDTVNKIDLIYPNEGYKCLPEYRKDIGYKGIDLDIEKVVNLCMLFE